MDSITQMLFGATVAQAGFHGRLGRKALVAGAAIALLPDLDVAAGWIGGRFAEWQHHRGLTHSLLFGPAVGPLLGWAIWRAERRRTGGGSGDDTLRAWIWLAILALITHPVIDLFTSYGTQLLWPLATTRFAVDALPIIDPVYSLALLAALVVGSMPRTRPAVAQDVGGAALLFIAVYTCGGWAINERVERAAAADFGRPATVDAYPLLFQPYYRRVVAMTPEAAHVGYYSVLNPKPIDWQAHRIDDSEAVTAVRRTAEAGIFEWFAMGKVLWRMTPDQQGGTRIEATDLRYGMPGPTTAGQWGIFAGAAAGNGSNGADGRDVMVRPFTVPRDISGAAFRRYWADITGW